MPDQPETDRDKAPTNNLSSYAGRWVALLGERVVGQGGTPDQAFKAAQADRFKEIPHIIFIPSDHPVMFPDILERVVASLPSDMPVYLVGGAVRDALLGRASHDLDFILPGEAISLGRSLARTLGAAFYPLDEERDTARLFLNSRMETVTPLILPGCGGQTWRAICAPAISPSMLWRSRFVNLWNCWIL